MKELMVNLKQNDYSIIISDEFQRIPNTFCGIKKKCVIITDKNVEKLYMDRFFSEVSHSYGEVLTYVVEPGEDSKSIEEARKIYSFLVQNRINRDDIIITFGGGVIGDLGGFVSATYLRGIKYIQVPTTLLSQVDSSIGGKTAVNIMHVKNVVGAFYQPAFVLINYSVLKTLPVEEVRNGLVEILVHAIIKDPDLFEFIETHMDKIEMLEDEKIERLIYCNLMIKKRVLERDEREQNERVFLNFGHTYGHAIESYYGYQYRHGECVALGIMGAFYLAEELGYVEKVVSQRVKKVLQNMKVLHNIEDCNCDEVINLMLHDKKIKENTICFILPHVIGRVEKYETKNIDVITKVFERLASTKW